MENTETNDKKGGTLKLIAAEFGLGIFLIVAPAISAYLDPKTANEHELMQGISFAIGGVLIILGTALTIIEMKKRK